MTIAVANVTTAGNIVYPSVGNTAVTYFALCNFTSGNVAANVYVVPNGETIANSNMLISNITLTGNDTYFLYTAAEKLILGNGDSIQVISNANSITSTTSYTSI
jgi:hypothetical protein